MIFVYSDTGLRTELWLVTDYHAHGALFDYLRATALTIEQAAIFISSIASGLAFLHAEITGTQCWHNYLLHHCYIKI